MHPISILDNFHDFDGMGHPISNLEGFHDCISSIIDPIIDMNFINCVFSLNNISISQLDHINDGILFDCVSFFS